MQRMRNVAGFTLMELVVVVAIMVALAAVVVPMVGSAKRDAQVAQVLQVTDSLRTACMKFHADTAKLAKEDSNADGANGHQLALAQENISGWKGPYISQALAKSEHPFGGRVNVFKSLDDAQGNGFDLTGDGTLDATGEGNFVRFYAMPEEIATLIDEALDDGVAGEWGTTGRVRYGENQVDIFLFDTDGS